MIQYTEEVEVWGLAEKILVGMMSSEKSAQYRTNELIKFCYAIAHEFISHKSAALIISKQEKK